MAVTIKWNGDKIMRQVQAEATRRLALAVSFVVVKVKENISTSSNRGATPSKSGEFPHADLGTLRNSIRGEVDAKRLQGRVGTNLFYARILELGHDKTTVIVPKKGKFLRFVLPSGEVVFTKRVVMKPLSPRPFLRRTLNEERTKVDRILRVGRV